MNIFWAEWFGKIKIQNNWWRPMDTYDNGDDRPAVLSEFMSLCCVLHMYMLAFRLGELCQCFPIPSLNIFA